MNRWALFVDAGWLFAGGSTSAFGGRIPRKHIAWDPAALIPALCAEGLDLLPSSSELLRVYWYDGSPNRLPIGDQHQVALQRDVKLRLGRTARDGQKGVDGLIIHDLITHAFRRTIEDAVVVSGDEDLLDAIESAQANGTRVHLLEIPIGGIADPLLRSFDNRKTLGADFWVQHLQNREPTDVAIVPDPGPGANVDAAVERGPAEEPPERPAQAGRRLPPPPARRPAWLDQPIEPSHDVSSAREPVDVEAVGELVARAEDFAEAWLESNAEEARGELLASRPYLGRDLDARLLADTSQGRWLEDMERRLVRDTFWTVIAEV